MGLKNHYIEIPPFATLFRKMYCHVCGNRMIKEKVSTTYKKGDEEFPVYIAGIGFPIGMDRYVVSKYIYKCQICNRSITPEDQLKISKIQKRKNRIVLSIDDLD